MSRTTAFAMFFVLAALVAPLLACGSAAPPVRYYQIALQDEASPGQGAWILSIEPLTADTAYDDPRIVYRENDYRLDYYHYHRWTAPPGRMISDYLRVAYQQTGLFRGVIGGYSGNADAILSGRLLALEEVNQTDSDWLARVRVELKLRDARTGSMLWSAVITETEPLEVNEPEGLARAMATAMTRLVSESAPAIAAQLDAR